MNKYIQFYTSLGVFSLTCLNILPISSDMWDKLKNPVLSFLHESPHLRSQRYVNSPGFREKDGLFKGLEFEIITISGP